MSQIYRMQIECDGLAYPAPAKVTFAFQSARKSFSIWFKSTDKKDSTYRLIPTGCSFPDSYDLVATAVSDDGFATFHLIREVRAL